MHHRRPTELAYHLLGTPRKNLANSQPSYPFYHQAMPLVFDTAAFGLTLFQSFTYWRTQINSPTLQILFRDGLIYFAIIFT